MANTFDSGLVTDVVRDTTITVLQKKLAPFRLFSREFGVERLAPKKNVLVGLVSATGSVVTNPTTFGATGDTKDKITVAVNHLHKGFGVTHTELQQGHKLEDLLTINLRGLANAALDVLVTPVTTTNFGAAAVTAAAVDFGTDDLITLHGAAKDFDEKNLILDGSYLAQFIPTDKLSFDITKEGGYGFDAIAPNNRWTSAGTNVVGFVAEPSAIAVASGLPVVDPAIANLMYMQEQILIEDIGLTVEFSMWGDLGTRNVYASYDVMLGAAKGDANRLKLVKSA